MNSFRILLAGMITTLLCGGVFAQQTKILTADKHNEYGLIYTLPITTLEIEVTAERTVNQAGPYYQYAKKFLGTDKVIKQDSEYWVIKDVRVTSYGVPDNDNRYLMQLKSGSLTYLCVDSNGMLMAINKEAGPAASSQSSTAKRRDEKTGTKKADSNLSLNDYLQYVSEDFIASQSSAKQAQMLAESLMEIRDAKISLTRGTAETMPADGKQLEIMLNSLSQQESSLMAAFTGISRTEEVTRKFTYTPELEGKTVLFRMSDFAGFVEADDYSGDPVYISVKITNEGKLPVDAKGEEKKLPKDAVIYNVPGTALISLSTLGRNLYEKEMEFSQMGVKFGLAPTLFTVKKTRSYAVFNPATGGLIEIGEDAGE